MENIIENVKKTLQTMQKNSLTEGLKGLPEDLNKGNAKQKITPGHPVLASASKSFTSGPQSLTKEPMSLLQGDQYGGKQKNTANNTRNNNRDNRNSKKTVESFVEGYLDDNTASKLLTSQKNRSELAELAKLQSEYDELTKQYADAQKALTGSAGTINTFVDEKTKTNPYAGKNVKLNGDNTYGYVTQAGVYKWYKDNTIIAATAGKNGCPSISEFTPIDLTTDNYKTAGSIINSTPPLLVGGAMQSGQSCGNEGTNVYVTQSQPTSATYSGCYKDTANSPGMALQNDGKVFNYNTCMQRAIDTSSKYFATQNYDSTSGLSNCYISNDLTKSTAYGSADVFTELKLWTFGSTDKKNSTMTLNNNGNIYIYNNSDIVQKLNIGPPECNVVPNIISASWGANVDNANVGNLTTIAKNLNTFNESIFSFSIPLDFADPAPNKEKTFDLSYKCATSGGTKSISQPAATKASVFTVDCSASNKTACSCYLLLGDGGKVSLNNGNNPSDTPVVLYKGANYDSTSDTLKLAWKDYDVTGSSKNTPFMSKFDATRKTTKNWIPSNSGLSPGEWFASNDGLLVLQMKSDGLLYLLTFTETRGCEKVSDTYYGKNLTNAIYGFESVPNNKNVGNIAYVDENSTLRNYLTDMIGFGDTYKKYTDYNISGNDIASATMPIDYSALKLTAEQAEAKCKAECDKQTNSGGYVFDSVSQKCWIKNDRVNISTVKTPKQNYTVNLKNPTVKNNNSCSKTIVPIFSDLWEKYVEGNDMSADETCGLASATSSNKEKVDELKKRLQDLSTKIVKKTNALENENEYINSKMKSSKEKYNKDIGDYIDVLKNIVLSEKDNSDNTLNSMLNDSDLVVLQENYKYLFWSIFAVSVVIITLNNVNKN